LSAAELIWQIEAVSAADIGRLGERLTAPQRSAVGLLGPAAAKDAPARFAAALAA
jgi:predicted Zn-dependent peptidase